MTQVTFAYKSGRERVMGRREAEILRRLGHGAYMTRDMRAETQPPAGRKDVPIEPKMKRKYTRKAKSK